MKDQERGCKGEGSREQRLGHLCSDKCTTNPKPQTLDLRPEQETQKPPQTLNLRLNACREEIAIGGTAADVEDSQALSCCADIPYLHLHHLSV